MTRGAVSAAAEHHNLKSAPAATGPADFLRKGRKRPTYGKIT